MVGKIETSKWHALDGDLVWNQNSYIGHTLLRCLVHVQMEILWSVVNINLNSE